MNRITLNGKQQNSWHQLHTEEVVALLRTHRDQGLSAEEVKKRLKEYGPNRVSRQMTTPGWKRFLKQFHQPLVYILLIAGAVTIQLGEYYVDASVILGVVLVNAIVGYLQEAKAEKAIHALTKLVPSVAMVRRNGLKEGVAPEELVPGDIVSLQAGDRVPADIRLYHARGLQIDESALTGESVPVHKHSEILELDTILAERKNLAYAGTMVTSGIGEGIVWGTGNNTETGRIAWLISSSVQLSTPLTRKIAEFSKWLLWVILALAAVTFMVGIWHGQNMVEMFMAAVALAVGAIPEGLPAAVTITLAIGVARMARRRAIIRHLPAVETLGSTTVICSDKTGTLTENQMTVREVYAGENLYHLTGNGYDPEGKILIQDQPIDAAKEIALAECLRAGLLCNDSLLSRHNGKPKIHGDPTEVALIVSAQKGGLIHAAWHGEMPRLDAIPFESEHQYMATLHHSKEGRVIYKKGAVEKVLERSRTCLDRMGKEVPLDKEAVRAVAEQMANRGLRVLAFARLKAAHDQHRIEHHHVAGGLVFLGLQGMIDPPRPEAIEAVRRCQNAGICVKMITGDHALTAKATAVLIGLTQSDQRNGSDGILTGRDLERIPDEDLPKAAEATAVFARVAPEQKLRLVRALQARGHVVAMTGDGVNDAPALKQADIGIAMGITGTDVAKEAADMILTDDNFASIEAAVEEGRSVYDNLTKFILWTLPTNTGEALILLCAIFFGTVLPALPVQLLWINMATAIFLGLMLVFEPKEPGLMDRPPRNPRQPILTFPLFMRTGLVTLLMMAGAFLLFLWELNSEQAGVKEARTVVVNVIVMVEIFYLLNCRSLTRSIFSLGLFSNPWVWAGITGMILAQLLFTYLPIMNQMFHSAPISGEAWARILGIGLLAYSIVGFEKWVRSRSKKDEKDAEI